MFSPTPSPPPPPHSDAPEPSSTQHPYSLQEFNAQPRTLPPRLQTLRSELDAADLQWRLHRQRVDADNESWWSEAATAFDRYERAADDAAGSDAAFSDPDAGHASLASVQDAARSRAYKAWLDERRQGYADYNRTWWRAQGGLVKGGWSARKRLWKWRWECFKAGIAP